MIISFAELVKRMSLERFEHTLNCVEYATRLAKRYGANTEDARDAALLHDITKDLSYKNQLKICCEHDIILSEITKKSPALLHAITGAVIARVEFSANKQVCGAIRWHTTGRAGMTVLEKIIWVADFIEHSRENKYADSARNAAFEDLDRALLIGLDATVCFLLEKAEFIDMATIEARNRILSEKKEEKESRR